MKKKKKNDSIVKTGFLVLTAAFFMGAAIFVVTSVMGRIHTDYQQYESEESSTQETTEPIQIQLKEENRVGWNELEEGWKYKLDEEEYAESQWLDIDGFLYYFDESGWMKTGEWKADGQIYTCHDKKGYLKKIEMDPDYIPEDTGENLDSLVRTNAFWCYLDSEDTGLFKKILYRKMTDNKVRPLGYAESPERTTRNSLRAYGDYVYYLPRVRETEMAKLSEEEKKQVGRLVRMIPGQMELEILAEDAEGYLVLDQTVYYSREGAIYKTSSGTVRSLGPQEYEVEVRGENCYLLDQNGNPPSAESGAYISVEDRIYRIESDGKIKYVKKGDTVVKGVSYYLSGSGESAVLKGKSSVEETTLAKGKYGIQSFCAAGNALYYCAYEDASASGEWYSRIYRIDLNSGKREAVTGLFSGTLQNMYYFESEGRIYAEYQPEIWKRAYGGIVWLGTDGVLHQLNDQNVRTGVSVSGNDLLELVMAKDQKVICLWHDCSWNRDTGIANILWSRAVTLSASSGKAVPVWKEIPSAAESTERPSETETSQAPVETIPLETKPAETGKQEPVKKETKPTETLPVETIPLETKAPQKQEVILGTDGPGSQSQGQSPNPSQTTQTTQETGIVIRPLN